MAARKPRRRGRPAAATRDDVLTAALHSYLRGRRVDVQAIAAELGVSRTSVYRWFGSREGLIGALLVALIDRILATARRGTRGKGGPGLVTVFDRYNRAVAEAPALRAFVEQERETALRVLASGAGLVQPYTVRRLTELIEEEAEAGTYEPPVEPSTLAYAVVRLGEAFIFNDVELGIRGDVERLRQVQAALMGVPAEAEGKT